MSGSQSHSHNMGPSQQQQQHRRRTPPQPLRISKASDNNNVVAPSSSPEGLSPSSSPNFHPAFLPALQHLARTLVPLVSITSGRPHPDFPRSILSYHLLNNEQLDDLARHYHQVWPPVPETFGYPLRIPAWIGTPGEKDVDIETKRRRIGRFAGLRGCESPVAATFGMSSSAAATATNNHSQHARDDEADARIVEEQMQKEWEEAMRRARCEDSDAILRMKAGGY